MWKIYYCIYSLDGKLEAMNRYEKEYKREGYAQRIAKKIFFSVANQNNKRILVTIGKTNPFTNMSLTTYTELKK